MRRQWGGGGHEWGGDEEGCSSVWILAEHGEYGIALGQRVEGFGDSKRYKTRMKEMVTSLSPFAFPRRRCGARDAG